MEKAETEIVPVLKKIAQQVSMTEPGSATAQQPGASKTSGPAKG